MDNARWLFFETPHWYISALGVVFKQDAFVFGALSWAGMVGLLAGAILGIWKKQAKLLWFLISPLLSQLLVVLAGLFRGEDEGFIGSWTIAPFLVIQIALLSYLIFRFRGMRASAASLSVFGISYALFSSFVATMSFTDTWL